MKPSPTTIMLLIGLQLTSACYQQIDNTTYLGAELVLSCTTTCSNVSSLRDTIFNCKDYGREQFLNITESNVTVLHSGDFSKFAPIEHLYLIGINIEEIQPGAFNGLSQLEELYLQNNHLKKLSNGSLDGPAQLLRLDLSNNSLSHIEATVFLRLRRLEHINLQQNRLTTIEDNLFDQLKRLFTLNLSGNPLHLSKLELGYTPNLLLLDLSNISLTDADLESFMIVSRTGIGTINLSSNLLTNPDCALLPYAEKLNLSNNALVNLQNISELTPSIVLDNNHLKSVEGFNGRFLFLSNNGIETVSKNLAGKKLLELSLSFNSIAVLNNDTFENYTSLFSLELQHNKISKIPLNLFPNMTKLYSLDLSFNLIEYIQDGTFNSLSGLERLNIGHNRFTTVPQDVFTSLPKLRFLHFDFNNISTLNTKDLTEQIPSLTFVYLDGNNWNCKQLVQIYRDLRGEVYVNF